MKFSVIIVFILILVAGCTKGNKNTPYRDKCTKIC